MNETDSRNDIALIVGGGPGISASCARLFADEGMRVAVAARNPDKPVLAKLEQTHRVRRYACDASDPSAVANAVRERNRRHRRADARGSQHRRTCSRYFPQGHHRSRTRHGARYAEELVVQRVPSCSTGRDTDANELTRPQRRQRNHRLHQRQCRDQRVMQRAARSRWRRTQSSGSPRAWRES